MNEQGHQLQYLMFSGSAAEKGESNLPQADVSLAARSFLSVVLTVCALCARVAVVQTILH